MLRRAAFSPNIKERADCSAALFTPDGELLVQAEHIPVHLGSMPASRCAAAIDAFGDDGLEPGDQVVLNDPFAGGTHLNDITLVAPCCRRRPAGRLGGQPGPPRRRGRRGARVDPGRRHRDLPGGPAHPAGAASTTRCAALLLANSRTPDERVGDLDAQVGANARRRRAPGRAGRRPARRSAEVVAYGERRMRAALAALPDGTWRFEDVLDSTGAAARPAAPGPGRRGRHRGRRRRSPFDFTGTDPQRPGQRQRRRGGDGRRPCRSPCGRRSTRPSRPTAAPCGRCGSWRRRARSWRPGRRRRWAPATSR